MLNSEAVGDEITLSVDTPALLSSLEHTFTSSTSVLTELAQNARRAGATKVEITIEDDAITVVDDGQGIASFKTLLAIAASGWDEAVKQTDQPYGLGVLAAIYSAFYIEVQSNGMGFSAKTSDILAMRPVTLSAGSVAKGTSITLRCTRFDNVAELLAPERWKGFPIPVIINGCPAERPDAMDGHFKRFEAGWIKVDINRLKPVQHVGAGGAIYLQGNQVCESQWNDAVCVHLDPSIFRGRAPDRTVIVNAEQALPAAHTAIRQCIAQELSEAARTNGDEWLLHRIPLLRATGLIRLLNDIDLLPSEFISKATYDDMNRALVMNRRGWPLVPCIGVSRAEVEQLPLIASQDHVNWDSAGEPILDNLGTGALLAAATLNAIIYLAEVGGASVSMKLDPGHWVYKLPNFTKSILARPAGKTPAVGGSEVTVQSEFGAVIGLFPAPHASLVGALGEIQVPFLANASDDEELSLTVTRNADSDVIVRAFNDFESGDLGADEAAQVDRANALRAEREFAWGASNGSAEIARVVRNAAEISGLLPKLEGRSFVLTIGEGCAVTVTAATKN